MSGLGDRLFEMVTGYTPDAQPHIGGWRDIIAEAVGVYGSERKASAALGVDRRTWQRWKSAEAAGRPITPRAVSIGKMIEGIRDARVIDRPTDQGLRLDIVESRNGPRDGSERTLTGRQLQLRPGTMGAVVEAYRKTGDPEIMALTFLKGIGNGFYRAALGAAVAQAPAGASDVDPDDLDPDQDPGEYEDAIDDLYEDYDGPDDLEDVTYEDAPADVFDSGSPVSFAVV